MGKGWGTMIRYSNCETAETCQGVSNAVACQGDHSVCSADPTGATIPLGRICLDKGRGL